MTDERIINDIAAIGRKVDRLEGEVKKIELEQVSMKAESRHIGADLKEIKAGISRLFWIMVAGVVTAAVAWVLQGGLMNVPS